MAWAQPMGHIHPGSRPKNKATGNASSNLPKKSSDPRHSSIFEHVNWRLLFPNAFTAANIMWGCLALVFMFRYQMSAAVFCVFAAAVFDFFDGFVARALNAGSEFGKQFDSLADLVVFGVVPGMAMFQMIIAGCGKYGESPENWDAGLWACALVTHHISHIRQ